MILHCPVPARACSDAEASPALRRKVAATAVSPLDEHLGGGAVPPNDQAASHFEQAAQGALAGVFGRGGQAPSSIPPEQIDKLSPAQVQQIAIHAEQHNPNIVDQMSSFYAQ